MNGLIGVGIGVVYLILSGVVSYRVTKGDEKFPVVWGALLVFAIVLALMFQVVLALTGNY